jgi:hypothetical protein
VSRSRRPSKRRAFYRDADAKRIESQRFRSRERVLVAVGRLDDLPANVRASRRWNLWNWD